MQIAVPGSLTRTRMRPDECPGTDPGNVPENVPISTEYGFFGARKTVAPLAPQSEGSATSAAHGLESSCVMDSRKCTSKDKAWNPSTVITEWGCC
eukprot:6261821-Prymnesium_polylepis.1